MAITYAQINQHIATYERNQSWLSPRVWFGWLPWWLGGNYIRHTGVVRQLKRMVEDAKPGHDKDNGYLLKEANLFDMGKILVEFDASIPEPQKPKEKWSAKENFFIGLKNQYKETVLQDNSPAGSSVAIGLVQKRGTLLSLIKTIFIDKPRQGEPLYGPNQKQVRKWGRLQYAEPQPIGKSIALWLECSKREMIQLGENQYRMYAGRLSEKDRNEYLSRLMKLDDVETIKKVEAAVQSILSIGDDWEGCFATCNQVFTCLTEHPKEAHLVAKGCQMLGQRPSENNANTHEGRRQLDRYDDNLRLLILNPLHADVIGEVQKQYGLYPTQMGEVVDHFKKQPLTFDSNLRKYCKAFGPLQSTDFGVMKIKEAMMEFPDSAEHLAAILTALLNRSKSKEVTFTTHDSKCAVDYLCNSLREGFLPVLPLSGSERDRVCDIIFKANENKSKLARHAIATRSESNVTTSSAPKEDSGLGAEEKIESDPDYHPTSSVRPNGKA